MIIDHIPEPNLIFGNKRKSVCPKEGIDLYNPYDISGVRPDFINIGLVGKEESIEKVTNWLNRTQKSLVGKPQTKFPNMFRPFPGFNQEIAFKSSIRYDDDYLRPVRLLDIKAAIRSAGKDIEKCIVNLAELFLEEIKYLSQNKSPNVILCLLDEEIKKISLNISNDLEEKVEEEDLDGDDSSSYIESNFRRFLKAKSMRYGVPTQILHDSSVVKPNQDEATVAWNLYTALYYKAGGTPWALENYDRINCFAGISFYKSRDRKSMQTSVAQVFDQLGQGVILRGSPIKIPKHGRDPHLTTEQAYQLIQNSLSEYHRTMRHTPQRLVIHKTSNFTEEEKEGFSAAAQEQNVHNLELVTILYSNMKIYGPTEYPVRRGTRLAISNDRSLLYTRGYVDFYGTYPGKYIPRALEVRLAQNEKSPRQICEEIMALTKMNWNNTQFDQRDPITIDSARKVGEILKYILEDETPQVRYSFYT